MSELGVFDPLVPDKCKGCGLQCDLATRLEDFFGSKDLLDETGDHLVGEAGEDFDATLEEHLPEQSAKAAAGKMRKFVGKAFDLVDGELEKIRDEIKSNELACSGVVKTTVIKDGVSYTANICTSSLQYMPDAPTLLPTLIRATPE